MIPRQRQEDGGNDLAGLNALQGEAAEIATPAERRMLQDHRAGAGDLAAHREALDQPQRDQQDRRPDADGAVGGQQRDDERRTAHQQHAQHQHRLPPVGVPQCPSTNAPIGRAT